MPTTARTFRQIVNYRTEVGGPVHTVTVDLPAGEGYFRDIADAVAAATGHTVASVVSTGPVTALTQAEQEDEAPAPHAAATAEELAERVKREITEDIAAGRVPADVASFGELHDHVDANTYGGLCDDDDPNSEIEHLDPINLGMQDIVDAWLAAGRPTARPTKTAQRLVADDHIEYQSSFHTETATVIGPGQPALSGMVTILARRDRDAAEIRLFFKPRQRVTLTTPGAR